MYLMLENEEYQKMKSYNDVTDYIHDNDLYNNITILKEIDKGIYRDITHDAEHAAQQFAIENEKEAEIMRAHETPNYSV